MRARTYSVHILGSDDGIIFAQLVLQVRELFRVERPSLSDEADGLEGQWSVIGGRQLVRTLKRSVQSFADSRVGTISTNKDVTIVLRGIGESNQHALLVLVEIIDSLAKIDILLGDLAQQEVVQVWTGDDV